MRHRRYMRGYGAEPAPVSRPQNGAPPPPGGRPVPNGTQQAVMPSNSNLNPVFIGLAVTVGVFVAMAIWQ